MRAVAVAAPQQLQPVLLPSKRVIERIVFDIDLFSETPVRLTLHTAPPCIPFGGNHRRNPSSRHNRNLKAALVCAGVFMFLAVTLETMIALANTPDRLHCLLLPSSLRFSLFLPPSCSVVASDSCASIVGVLKTGGCFDVQCTDDRTARLHSEGMWECKTLRSLTFVVFKLTDGSHHQCV